jgi:diguanylate cyclase (GGDEF)-like protein
MQRDATREVLRSGARAASAADSASERERARLAEAGLHRAQQMARLAHVVTSRDGSFEHWFETLPQLLRRAPADMPKSTREWLALLHPDDREDFRVRIMATARSGEPLDIQYRLLRGDGSWAHMRQAIEPIAGTQDEHGRRRWFNTLQDISEYKDGEERYRRLNRLYAVLSGINALIVRVRDRRELFREVCRVAVDVGAFRLATIRSIDASTARVRLVAWTAAAGVDVGEFQSSSDELGLASAWPACQAARDSAPVICNDLVGELSPSTETRSVLGQGLRSMASFPIMLAGRPTAVFTLFAADTGAFDEGETALLRDLARDISFALDHLDKEERLDHLAHYDGLTGLANTSLFRERLPRFTETAERNGHKLALLILDIDRFKTINDSLGRHAGDQVLRELGARLARNPVGASTVARIGADRFAVVVPDVKQDADIARILEERLHGWVDDAIRTAGTDLRISVKLGIALYPNDGSDPETLLRNAEAALKRAKATGERYLFYTEEMTARIAERLGLENKLRQALQKDEFVLHYQPKVAVADRRVQSVEALIRWDSPELGLVPPGKFIPLLEETGMIVEVGAWALRRAVRDQQFWREQGLHVPRVAVNVSALQLRRADFAEVVRDAIAGPTAPAIDIEITETLVMQDIEANVGKLKALRSLGVEIAIDDFGTGYSSLAYLARLPVQALKIDRSFISAMAGDGDVMTVVSTIVSLAHAMRLKVIAEGVEQESQVDILRALRCEEMQGYLVSRPVGREVLAGMLQRA